VGVSVILGLTTATHPLILQRGFYVLDGVHRLFTMPFKQATEEDPTSLTMWQLSFSDVGEDEALWLKTASPSDLRAEASRRTASWMSPVADMIAHTPDEHVWGTPLYDRDPMQVYTKKNDGGLGSGDKVGGAVTPTLSRVTLLGDACHPMSMFKGQGANQALEDGPLLASWLCRPKLSSRNIFTRLRCFEREMVARTTPKVMASREAAAHLHSLSVVEKGYNFGFEGCPARETEAMLEALRLSKVDASCGMELDANVRTILQNRNLLNCSGPKNCEMQEQRKDNEEKDSQSMNLNLA